MREFTEWLIALGTSSSTAKRYTQMVERFLGEKVSFITFAAQLKRKGYVNNTVNAYVKALRRYGQFIGNSELKTLRFLPKNNSSVSTLTDDEINRFLAITASSGSNSKQVLRHEMATLFFSVMAYTGMRPIEIRNLTVSDIDFRANQIRIHATKTDTIRTIPIPDPIFEALRNHVNSIDREKLFIGFSNQSLYYHFHNRLERLGITRKGLRVYSLRHSYATRMVDADIDPFSVKELLGHKDLSMTERYYHLSAKRLQKVVKKDPLSKQQLSHRDSIKLLQNELIQLLHGFDYDLRNVGDALEVTIRGPSTKGMSHSQAAKPKTNETPLQS